MNLSPDDVLFCLLSFEGPDPYSPAGGLGVRVTHLAETLAERGFETHLFFVGDPSLPDLESQRDGRLTWHRWCQWMRTRPRSSGAFWCLMMKPCCASKSDDSTQTSVG